MVDLKARSPCHDLLPVTCGAVHLAEVHLGPMTTLAPYADQQGAASQALEKAHGVRYPAPNTTHQKGATRIIWFGRDTALLVGVTPAPELGRMAALTDQSDAWATVTLSGAGAEDVLARLVPVDLRSAQFANGKTVRTLVGHMNASITRIAPDALLILVFRSMAATLVDELQEAMEAVAARG